MSDVPEPTTAAGRAGLAALLAEPASGLIALDFDGTLSHIVPQPPTARPSDGVIEALVALSPLIGTLAIITGRPAQWVAEDAGLRDVPQLVILGQYGAERWSAGELSVPDEPPGISAVRQALPLLLADADPDVWVEDKALSLVVHTRRAADPAAELTALTDPVQVVAERHGLEANAGRNVLEVRLPGVDKGGALESLAGEASRTAVLFAGDDLGDLPGFDAVDRLRAQGIPGLTVASASPETSAVSDRADIVVEGPDGIAGLLGALVAVLR